jgi:hypothetical protein
MSNINTQSLDTINHDTYSFPQSIKDMAQKYPSKVVERFDSSGSGMVDFKSLAIVVVLFLVLSLPVTYSTVGKLLKLTGEGNSLGCLPINLVGVHTAVFALLLFLLCKFQIIKC